MLVRNSAVAETEANFLFTGLLRLASTDPLTHSFVHSLDIYVSILTMKYVLDHLYYRKYQTFS